MGCHSDHRHQLPSRISVRYHGLSNLLPKLRLIIAYSRHLLGTGREKEALAALCYINGLPEDDPIVQEALEELAVAIRAENEVCNP